jgi:hypothetical protein
MAQRGADQAMTDAIRASGEALTRALDHAERLGESLGFLKASQYLAIWSKENLERSPERADAAMAFAVVFAKKARDVRGVSGSDEKS